MPDSPDQEDSLEDAQPAEEIPDWLTENQPEEAPMPAAPDEETEAVPAATLADQHKARRQAIERQTQLTPTEEDQPSLLDGLRAFPGRVAQAAGAAWQRLTHRTPTAPDQPEGSAVPDETAGETPLPVEPPTARPLGPPDEGSPWHERFRRNAGKTWQAMRPYMWRSRLGPAFWTVASLLSVTVNIILIVVLILLGRQLFVIKQTMVADKLVGGLYDNFVLMDQAHIQTTIQVSDTIQVNDNIQVNDTIPVVFDLPLNQKTAVILTKDTPVNTTIFLNNAAVPLDLILKEGTELNIKLNMSVPVSQTVPVVLDVPVHLNVPVQLTVPVDIPLDQTQLHQPFVGLQHVVSPYRQLLNEVPSSWPEVCKGSFKFVCNILRFK